jgi:hypothetical protein
VAQRHHRADRVALADLEPGDRLARLGHDRLLAGDLRHVGDRVVEQLLVAGRLADAHVEHDLLDARHLHHRLVPELLDQRGHHFVPVLFLQTRHDFALPSGSVEAREGDCARATLVVASLLPAGANGPLPKRRRGMHRMEWPLAAVAAAAPVTDAFFIRSAARRCP